MGPLKSETFTSDAADQGGRFYSDNRPVENGTAGGTTLSISYNATSQSYTVSTPARSQTFAAADLVASGSADFIAYAKTNGSFQESLALIKPGTSGPLSYKYVGAGAWERANLGTTTLDWTYNPFTYGIATPDASLQRSGTGLYSVSLVGARSMGVPYAMAGTGTMQVDFLSGNLSSSGVLTTIDVGTGIVQGLGVYYGSASLSSSANSFAGSFGMDDTTRFTGGWEGRFYGPNNQEVGAVWHIASNTGEFASGWMVGRTDSSVTAFNTSLTNLQFSESFDERTSELSFSDLGNGKTTAGSVINRSDTTLAYDATAGSYRYTDASIGIDTTFASSDKSSAKSNSSVDVYEMIGTGGVAYRLSLSKPGSGNPQIALTYASFGHWEQAQTSTSDTLDRWFAWGVRTNGFQVPTGTGHYDGILLGKATTILGGPAYNLTGTSTFDVDFGASTFTGSLHPIGTNLFDNSTRDFGTFAVKSGIVDVDAGLYGVVVNSSDVYLGQVEGALYGPTASEVAGAFGFQTETTGSGTPSASAAYLNGVVLGKRTGN